MELRMKNFNIWTFTEKSDFQGGISQKSNKEGGLPKKGAGTVCRFKGWLVKKEEEEFVEWGLYPDAYCAS